jgi:hypothetical protein
MRPNNSLRWLIFLPAAILALAAPAKAEAQPGLNAVGYTYEPTGIPLRVDDLYPICGSEIENNINRNFNGEPFQNCGYDFFMVHYSGFITLPEHETIQFMVAADDGGTIQIGNTEFGTWNLKGCSWSQQVSLDVGAGTYPLDGWFFEWGGGTCYMLAWNIDNEGWAIVPDEAFTQTSTPPTTTTTVPETTVPETTLPETTTTEPVTTTTELVTTTTEQTTTTTTTTTTVYVPPATTTTEPEPEPETTTTTEPVEEEAPPLDSTIPQPEDDEPQDSTPETPPTTEPEMPQPETTLETETTLEETSPEQETEEESSQSTIPEAPTSEQALVFATNPEVLATISSEEAEAIFEALDLSTLDESQVAELVAAVQDAPTEVREAFEEKVDIFKEGLDDYIPTGSNIPVGQRRALIAIGAAITAAGATRIRR